MQLEQLGGSSSLPNPAFDPAEQKLKRKETEIADLRSELLIALNKVRELDVAQEMVKYLQAILPHAPCPMPHTLCFSHFVISAYHPSHLSYSSHS